MNRKILATGLVTVAVLGIFFTGCRRNKTISEIEETTASKNTEIETSKPTPTETTTPEYVMDEQGRLQNNHFKVEVDRGVYKDLTYEQYQKWLRTGKY